MTLRDGIERYVSRKQTNGCRFEHGHLYLAGLYRQLGDIDLDQLETRQISAYLNSQAIAISTWRMKYQVLLRFFEFWISRGVMAELQMPTPKPPERQTFVPYIFSRMEMRGLIKATSQDQRARLVDRRTMRAIILFLYGTGTMLGEALNLTVQDLDLNAGLIDIRTQQASRCRRIPLGRDLREVLQKYLAWRTRRGMSNKCFFVTKGDRPVTKHLVDKSFQRLRGIANIIRRDGASYQPRLLDLKYTFAVHRITSWIQNGYDLNRMLPALAAYMGQAGLGSTERYLHLTPERFRKELRKLSPTCARGHWRDDAGLMRFLTSL